MEKEKTEPKEYPPWANTEIKSSQGWLVTLGFVILLIVVLIYAALTVIFYEEIETGFFYRQHQGILIVLFLPLLTPWVLPLCIIEYNALVNRRLRKASQLTAEA